MAVGFVEQYLSPYVLNTIGIWGLLGALFIIIAYMVRPKRKIQQLASVVFLMNQKSHQKRYRWMKFIPRQWMLLLHLLIILGLIAALLNPFILSWESLTKQHAIHVVDVSASMNTADRFDQMLLDIDQNLARENTIILVNNQPSVALERVSALQVRTFLEALKPQHTATSLVDGVSLVLALQAENSVVHIYSDFVDTTDRGAKLQDTITRLQGGNNVVISHEYMQGSNVVGITGAEITASNITLTIRNFGSDDLQVPITDGKSSQTLLLPSQDITSVSFPTPKSSATIALSQDDDFVVDNTFYFSAVPNVQVPLLYVTNDANPYIVTAMSLIDFVGTTVYQPPGVSNADQHNVFIFENVELDKLLPGTVLSALDQVAQGGLLVIKMSDMMQGFNLGESNPVADVQERKKAEVVVDRHELTESLTAGSAEMVYTATPVEDATVLMSTSNGEPVIVVRPHGDGMIMYYGIDDTWAQSAFKLSYAYPILFNRVLLEALSFPTLEDINKKSGENIAGSGAVELPDGSIVSLPASMDYIGTYKRGPIDISANLINALESSGNISYLGQQNADVADFAKEETKVPVGIGWIIALAVLGLLLFELITLKWRGDL